MKTIDEMIAVMQAFKEGKKIEYHAIAIPNKKWQKAARPSWDWSNFDYRITREPKEIWVNEYHHSGAWLGGGAYSKKEHAESLAAEDAVRKAVHYREVLEE